MVIEIRMTEAAPGSVRANGDIKLRGQNKTVKYDISTRILFSDRFELKSGEYTYVFGIDRKAKFKISAVDATTGHTITKAKSYAPDAATAELRFHFEVP